MFGGIGFPGHYWPSSMLKRIRQKHMRYCDMKRGQTVVIEQKDGEVKKAAIMDMPYEGISVKLEDGRDAFFARADFGYTWRCWWRRPMNQDRLSDPWR
jgi:hypothetical protein